MATSERPTHIEVSTPAPGDGETVSVEDARQANPGKRILMILVISLGAAILVLGAYWGVNAPKLHDADVRAGIDHGPVAAAPASTGAPVGPGPG